VSVGKVNNRQSDANISAARASTKSFFVSALFTTKLFCSAC